MAAPDSPFAPPRAGRAAGLWRAWFATRRKHALANRRRDPDEELHSPWMLVAVVAVPLLGLRFSPHRLLLLFSAPILVIALFLAFADYGELFGGAAFGIAIAIHAASVGAYVQSVWPAPTTLFRVVRQVGIALAVMLVSISAIPRLMSTLVLRVPAPGGVMLINPRSSSAPYTIGEHMTIRLQSYGGQLERTVAHPDNGEAEPLPDTFQRTIYVNGPTGAAGIAIHPGLYLGRILASPGDRVTFTKGFFSVNDGALQPALPLMPAEGEITVPAKRVLVWPVNLNIPIPNGNTGWRLPPEGLLLRESALIGRPYKRWFWRTFTP